MVFNKQIKNINLTNELQMFSSMVELAAEATMPNYRGTMKVFWFETTNSYGLIDDCIF